MSFLKKVTKSQKNELDVAGELILKEFANNMKHGVDPKDKLNLVVVQKHFNWAKSFMNNSKLTYMHLVKGYTADPKNFRVVSKYGEGLPEYIKASALFHISEIM
jgi:hypothetical protein